MTNVSKSCLSKAVNVFAVIFSLGAAVSVLGEGFLPNICDAVADQWEKDQPAFGSEAFDPAQRVVFGPQAIDNERRYPDRDLGFEIAFNAGEICDLRIPSGGNILDYSDFLYARVYKNYLKPRMTQKDINPLSLGEMKALAEVYRAQIAALETITSLGYQSLMFNKNINSTNAAVKIKNACFSDGTLFGNSVQAFFDNESKIKKDILLWGENYTRKSIGKSDLQKIVGKSLSWKEFNERYFVHEHMGGYDDDNDPERISKPDRYRYWYEIREKVETRISNLYELKVDVENYAKRVDAFAHDDKYASDPRFTLAKVRFSSFKFNDGYVAKNADAVRKAREIFYDVPFFVATKEYFDFVDELYPRLWGDPDRPKVLTSLTMLKDDLGGDIPDAFMLGAKSDFAHRYYREGYNDRRDDYIYDGWHWSETEEEFKAEFDNESKSVHLKIRDVNAENSLWKPNALVDFSTADVYTLSLVNEGGCSEQKFTYTTDKSKARINNPDSRPGYRFDGWRDEINNKIDNYAYIKKNLTLTAKWTPIPLTAMFIGQAVDIRPIEFNVDNAKDHKLPAPRPRKGYDFGGWLRKGTSNQVKDLNGVKENIALEAKWIAISHKVTYFNESGSQKIGEDFFNIDSNTKFMQHPPVVGKEPDGWVDKNSGVRVDSLNGLDRNVELKAKYRLKPLYIKYDTAVYSWNPRVHEFNIESDGGWQPPKPTAVEGKTGYDFKCWTLDGKEITSIKGFTEGAVLKAKWEPHKYKMAFYDGDKMLNEQPFTIEDVTSLKVVDLPGNTAEKFYIGWCSDKAGKAKDVLGRGSLAGELNLERNPRDVRLYAISDQVVYYTLDFKDGDNALPEIKSIRYSKVDAENGKFELPRLNDTPEKIFKGWKDDVGNTIDMSSLARQQISKTLYARWENKRIPKEPSKPVTQVNTPAKEQPPAEVKNNLKDVRQNKPQAQNKPSQRDKDFGYDPATGERPGEDSKTWTKEQWTEWFADHPDAIRGE